MKDFVSRLKDYYKECTEKKYLDIVITKDIEKILKEFENSIRQEYEDELQELRDELEYYES